MTAVNSNAEGAFACYAKNADWNALINHKQNSYTPGAVIENTGEVSAEKKPENASLEKAPENDTVEISQCTDGIDDGRISLKEKILSFGKGVVYPFTSMLKSRKNFVIGLVSILGAMTLTALTSGAVLPFFVAAGVISGGVTVAKNAKRVLRAKTDSEAKSAWQGIGTGSGILAASVISSKGALKTVNVKDVDKMGYLKSTAECFKNLFTGFKPASAVEPVCCYTESAVNNANAFPPSKTARKIPPKIRRSLVGEEALARIDAERRLDNVMFANDMYIAKMRHPSGGKSASYSAAVFEEYFEALELAEEANDMVLFTPSPEFVTNLNDNFDWIETAFMFENLLPAYMINGTRNTKVLARKVADKKQ